MLNAAHTYIQVNKQSMHMFVLAEMQYEAFKFHFLLNLSAYPNSMSFFAVSRCWLSPKCYGDASVADRPHDECCEYTDYKGAICSNPTNAFTCRDTCD